MLEKSVYKSHPYSYNIALLKEYGDGSHKLVQMKSLRNRGVELPVVKKGTVNCEKLDNNIVRARSTVREMGLCNDWDFFLTLTISPDKFDRYNLADFRKILSQWVRDYRKKYSLQISYLFIPEKHKDGAWHLHGFISGLPLGHLSLFSLNETLPFYIRSKLQLNQQIYNWSAYADRFGYVTLEPIRSKEKAVSYITKYITKDLSCSVCQLGSHLYFASQGLKRAVEVKRGKLTTALEPDFSNDFCSVNYFDYNFSTDYLCSMIASENKEGFL